MSKLFILSGIFFLIFTGFLIWERNSPQRLSFNIDNSNQKILSPRRAIFPRKLIIKDLNINLIIYPAVMKNGNWDATTEGVSYLSSSTLPGEIGNSIMYGHNWVNLLGQLTNAKPGQKGEIIFDDGQKKEFTIKFTSVVTPDETHILSPSKDARLTLYTCTGFLDTKRFVITAIFQSKNTSFIPIGRGTS